MLAVNLAKISYEESVFITWLANFMIDILDSVSQDVPNDLFRRIHAIMDLKIRTLQIFKV